MKNINKEILIFSQEVTMDRIHKLMDRIEDRTGMIFHERYPAEFELYKRVSDGKSSSIYMIECLNKILDQLTSD
jgi:hypothetical protein